jgi:hypothetical protein
LEWLSKVGNVARLDYRVWQMDISKVISKVEVELQLRTY